MSDEWEPPDVAPDGTIKGEGYERDDDRRPAWQRGFSRARYSLEAFWLRQRSNAWRLVQIAGFAAFFFGTFRLFGIGVFGMDGLGSLPREFFTTVYLPGPWRPLDTVWMLAWAWMGIGIALVVLSTRKRRL